MWGFATALVALIALQVAASSDRAPRAIADIAHSANGLVRKFLDSTEVAVPPPINDPITTPRARPSSFVPFPGSPTTTALPPQTA